MEPISQSRADLHCHSSASERSRLGVQRSLGLPECATDPFEAYELARRRGMDFVTLTDHDTIEGAKDLAGLPGFFCSEELTAWFAGEPQAVHVLCWGIDEDDHARLQERALDVEACAEYLHGNGIACALAHPFHTVAAELEPRHRRRLAELFPVWEVRNGARAHDLNAPAVLYAQACGNAACAGSDDHAGVDIGRTWTATPAAESVEGFLEHLREGRTTPCGSEGSGAKWAHAAMALAVRSLGPVDAGDAPDPWRLMTMSQRVLEQGSARTGAESDDLGPDDARALLGAFLEALDTDGPGLLATMQGDGFAHEHLERRALRVHERRLAAAAREAVGSLGGPGADPGAAVGALFSALVPAVPYVVAGSFLARERARAGDHGERPPRVALVADGLSAVHGVARALDQVRQRGVPGYEVEVLGTDAAVDRRLPAVTEVTMPTYDGLRLGVPSLPGVADALASGHYDLVHVATPGPCGVAAALAARLIGLPVIASHHTELGAYARVRSGRDQLGAMVDMALGAFYATCELVLSPSSATDVSLRALGLPAERIARWDRGVDLNCFGPGRRRNGRPPGRVDVLYAGRLSEEKGVGLLADAFLEARSRDPRLHLLVAGGGPEEGALHERVGEHATFCGWLEGEDLAAVYAGADVFCFPSTTDTFGQAVVEAQASGVPVLAAAAGGPLDLIVDGVSGVLRPAEVGAFADALVELAGAPARRSMLGRNGQAAANTRSWERSMERLGAGYVRALGGVGMGTRREAQREEVQHVGL